MSRASMIQLRRLIFLALILLICLIGAGCGGSGTVSGSNTSNPAPSLLSYGDAKTYTVGIPIDPLNPAVSGTVTRYSISSALPAGLALNATSGQISGTPTAASTSTIYTITASNSSGSAKATLSITVIEIAPAGLTYSSPARFAAGAPITPLLPSVSGWVANYSVFPALPTGLTLDAHTGRISGTPSVPTASSNYRITASNGAGSTDFDLSISVIGIQVLSGSISRIVVSGTSIDVAVVVRPIYFTFIGTLSVHANATSIFSSNVTVMDNDDGSYTFTLKTLINAPASRYSDNVSLALCGDPGCATSQPAPSMTIPYNINVMSADSLWPGDNLSPLMPWADAPDWSTFQGNSAHTGYVPVDLYPDQFSTRWLSPPAIVSGGFIKNVQNLATTAGLFFVSGSNKLYARSEFDGTEMWHRDFSGLENPSVNPPAVDNGIVYIAAGQQSSTGMYAINAEDGSLVFSSGMSSQWEHYLAPTIGSEGIYVNAGTYGGMYAFDRSGKRLFPFTGLAQTSLWTPAVDDYGVYTYTGGYLRVFNPMTGTKVDEIYDSTFQNYIYEIGGSPVLGAPGSVFAVNYANSILNDGAIGNTLLHFDLLTDSINWKISGVYPSTPAYNNGMLYIVNENQRRLEVRAENNGDLVWWWTPPHTNDSKFLSEVLLTQHLVFVSTNIATYVIDLETHRTVWSYPMPGRLAMSKNGILYIQGDTLLVAINVK
jgi:hypothetical protein